VRSRDYPRAVDRIPYSAMLETHEEIHDPAVRPIHFPIRIRWLILGFKTRSTWRDWWRDLIFLVTG
jgi:hypothetical protein